MKTVSHLLLLLLFWLNWTGGAVQASEAPRIFLDGVQAYQQGHYAEAATAFIRLADSGINNGNLFYNLGNACLKNDDLGQAVLWYERALKQIPHDPDLKFNREYAQSLTRDAIPDSAMSLRRVLFFWKYALSQRWIQIGAIVLNMIFWALLVIRLMRNRPTFNTAGYVCLVLGIVLILTAVYNRFETHFHQEAVILPAVVSVRSGLTDDATELFVLHAGTKVTVDRELDQHVRIAFTEDKIGWLKKTDVGMI